MTKRATPFPTAGGMMMPPPPPLQPPRTPTTTRPQPPLLLKSPRPYLLYLKSHSHPRAITINTRLTAPQVMTLKCPHLVKYPALLLPQQQQQQHLTRRLLLLRKHLKKAPGAQLHPTTPRLLQPRLPFLLLLNATPLLIVPAPLVCFHPPPFVPPPPHPQLPRLPKWRTIAQKNISSINHAAVLPRTSYPISM